MTRFSDVKEGLMAMVPRRHHKYAALPIHNQTDAPETPGEKPQQARTCTTGTRRILQTAVVAVVLFLAVHIGVIYRQVLHIHPYMK